MKILNASQMQRVDRLTSSDYGVQSLSLMENAGNAVVRFLGRLYSPLESERITILCGKGNNGGDGLVVARLLKDKGLSPLVLLFGDPASLAPGASSNYSRLKSQLSPRIISDLAAWSQIQHTVADSTLIVDALLGTGLTKPLQGLLLEVVRFMNSLAAARRVSIDLPTGMSADTGNLIGECVHADATVTFTAPKYAHVFPPACELVGKWEVEQIATPLDALERDPDFYLSLTRREEVSWLAAPRKMESHKGTYGHVLILAGSVGKTGAAVLAAKTALRSGAGLVTIATPSSALPVIASLGMEYMSVPLPETGEGTASLNALEDGLFDRLVEGKSILALGPGVSLNTETAELVRQVVNRYPLPVVLDADGLNAFGGRAGEIAAAGRVRVLTPHPGEMSRLAGFPVSEVQKRRVEVARQFAMRYGIHLVLKGARTLVASPEGRVAVNPTGNPGMATGGTGDCLTGLVAGLLAQHPSRSVEEVVATAVYVHGLAGDIAAKAKGEASMIAGDLVESVPRALKSLRRKSEHCKIL
ncbi:MAG: NAD(P)H-hydrate dehydratase [Acidobacteriota bacterium]|nr:NAD(P)H-hydrate dehydratase [Acidobacteriota bacterium]